MKNNFLSFLLLPIILVSCGGGGGGSSFVLTVQQFTSFNVNEDESYETVISASTNKPAAISFTISRPSNNANITISSSGNLSYTPNPDYFGSDSFSITITASEEGQSTYESKILNVTANVIAVNDIPTIVINDDLTVYDQSTLIFDDLVSINVTLADVDNTANQLSVYGSIEGQTLPGIFTQDLSIPGGGTGTAEINISSNQYAGLHFMDICVTDGSNSSCGGQMQAYFPGNREIKSVDYCCLLYTSDAADD